MATETTKTEYVENWISDTHAAAGAVFPEKWNGEFSKLFPSEKDAVARYFCQETFGAKAEMEYFRSGGWRQGIPVDQEKVKQLSLTKEEVISQTRVVKQVIEKTFSEGLIDPSTGKPYPQEDVEIMTARLEKANRLLEGEVF